MPLPQVQLQFELLSQEILASILSYVERLDHDKDRFNYTKPSLCALALTCKTVSLLVRPYIFREINTSNSSRCDTASHTSLRRLRDSLRSCSHNPKNLHNIYKVSLHWGERKSDDGSEVCKDIISVLAKSTSLTEITLDLSHHDDVNLDVLALFSRLPSDWTRLETLKLCFEGGSFITTRAVVAIARLPSLTKISIAATVYDTIPEELAIANNTSQTMMQMVEAPKINSLVESVILDHSGTGAISQVSFGVLIRLLPNLKDLSTCYLSAPPLEDMTDELWDPPYDTVQFEASLAETNEDLSTCVSTLQSLFLTSGDSTFPHTATFDGCQINLSGFNMLERCVLGSEVFFGESSTSIGTPSIVGLLPPNLKRLRIYFMANADIFWSLEEMGACFSHATIPPFNERRFDEAKWLDLFARLHVPGNWRWIQEVLEAKHNTLPKLTHFEIDEFMTVGDCVSFCHELVLPCSTDLEACLTIRVHMCWEGSDEPFDMMYNGNVISSQYTPEEY